MSNTTKDKTAEVLKGMLTENTGTHFMDSGGANGRHWQQNQSVDFDAQPETVLTFKWGYLSITHNVYHWLKSRLEFNQEIDDAFNDFLDEHETGKEGEAPSFDEMQFSYRNGHYEFPSWLSAMECFVGSGWREYGRPAGIYGEGGPVTVNTYNGEDLLSQTIQYVYWEDSNGEHIMLQLHNGADVRGGYTKPRAFDVGGDYGELAIFDNAHAGISCDKCNAAWHTDDGYHWYPNNNEEVQLENCKVACHDDEPPYDETPGDSIIFVNEDGQGECPFCDGKLSGGFF